MDRPIGVIGIIVITLHLGTIITTPLIGMEAITLLLVIVITTLAIIHFFIPILHMVIATIIIHFMDITIIIIDMATITIHHMFLTIILKTEFLCQIVEVLKVIVIQIKEMARNKILNQKKTLIQIITLQL